MKERISIILLIGGLFFIGLGSRPLNTPDEARYCEIPFEMVTSGNYLTPHLDHLLYFEKPPLFYWIQTLALHTHHLNEWVLRLPTMLLALIGCLVIYTLGCSIYDRKTGLYSAFILGTSFLYFAMAHIITIDMTFTTVLTLCLSCLLFALQRDKRYGWMGAYIFAGAAVLTKGLVGILLPGAIFFAWIAILNQWAVLKRCHLRLGLILFLIVTLPWHLLMQRANPDFFNFYIINQQFLRFFTMSAGRYQPAWFFFAVLGLGLFPWIIFFPQSCISACPFHWKDRKRYATEIFLLLWSVIIFTFFSLSKSKLIPYILPTFPPIALLIGRYFSSLKQVSRASRLSLIFISFLFSIALVYSYHVGALPPTIFSNLVILVLILCIGSVSVFSLTQQKSIIFVLLVGFAASFNLGLLYAAPKVMTDSIKPLILASQPWIRPDTTVVVYGHYYQDVPFYLKQPVKIVNWENELSFGMQHDPKHQIALSEMEFWKAWDAGKPMVVFMSQDQFQRLLRTSPHSFHLIARCHGDVVLTNS